MKIARVEAFHVDWGGERCRSAWVRIWTDAGVYRLGGASPMVHGNASLEIIAVWPPHRGGARVDPTPAA